MTRLSVLIAAVRAAIRNNTKRSEISVPHWARSYRVTQSQVREAWADEMTKIPPSIERGCEK